MSKRVAVFVGTRPEIIKMAPLIDRIRSDRTIDLLFVHTGQHYDWALSASFVKELDLPRPDHFLKVGSASHAKQTANVMERAEKILHRESPEVVLVEGDTNSVLGVALAAVKLKIPLGHVEAGCRSFDRNMPEELNRILVADCASLHFAPTLACANNLRREGIPKEQIYLTGHPIVESVKSLKHLIERDLILSKLRLVKKRFVLLTVHREENSDNPARMRKIVRAVNDLDLPVLFPIHPRTRKNVERFGIRLGAIRTTNPLGYVHTLNLIKNAYIVCTDSGGIQQEACLLRTPCVTLRRTTEWFETVKLGVNFLAEPNGSIVARCRNIRSQYSMFESKFSRAQYVFGRGNAAAKILEIVRKKLDDW